MKTRFVIINGVCEQATILWTDGPWTFVRWANGEDLFRTEAVHQNPPAGIVVA